MTTTSPFFPRKYTCPVCHLKFTTLAVRSSMVYVQQRESDFHTIYRGISPLHYSMVVCPACNYAASQKVFAQELPAHTIKPLSLALCKLKEENPIDLCSERNIETVLRCFQMAVRTAQLKKVSEGELAGLLLGTAWIAREIGNSETETYYLKEALQSYLRAYQNGFATIGNLDDIQAAYLIGELNLRCNNYSEAVNWFNQVIVHKNIKRHPVEEKLAREQWALAREAARQNPDQVIAEEVTPIAAPAAEAPETVSQRVRSPLKKRTTLQMNLNLYSDQIDWLSQVVNNGYDYSQKLITKEQVVRSLFDAVIAVMNDTMPENFSNEDELKQNLINILKEIS